MDIQISLTGRKGLSDEVYRQLRAAIVSGLLKPGQPLPPSRELAGRLSVSRNTIIIAYERLAGEGFISSRMGAGTFVSDLTPTLPREDVRGEPPHGVLRARPLWDTLPLVTVFDSPAQFDFRSGVPDAALFPHEKWRNLLSRPRNPYVPSLYEGPAGHPELRAAILRHIAVSRSVRAEEGNVTVVNGTQQGLDILARILLAPGDRVAVEDPGYSPARHLFASLGIEVCGVPVDADGLVIDAIPEGVRAIYVTPSHQYPLGMPMALPRRRALLEWAERTDAAIIEDDYDSEFRYAGRPIEPLQTLDTAGRVIYVGSFSKTMLPSLRLGFVITPPSLTPAVHKAKQLADWHTSWGTQAALAQFIDEGGFARHIRKMNAVYRVRHEAIRAILARDFAGHLEVVPSSAGLHVTATALHASVAQMRGVIDRVRDAGVAAQDLSRMTLGRSERGSVILGFGAIRHERIAEGLRRLRLCFEEQGL